MEEGKTSVDDREYEIKCPVDENENLECTRYYMPLNFDWLKKKVPFINLWSNLCLGDLKRFIYRYNYKLPAVLCRSIADSNQINATVEHFFSLKKNDRLKLQQPLPQCIEKCRQDNRGLRRQFLNGVKTHIRERTMPPVIKKSSENSSTKSHMDRKDCNSIEYEFSKDHDELCKVIGKRSGKAPVKRKKAESGFNQ